MDYSFEEMRRGLVRGWSDLGARTADCWLDYNTRFFGAQLLPLPMFFVQASPYGGWVGLTCAQHPVSHIALCRPKSGNPQRTAGRNTLLHEMVHVWLDQQGKDPAHAGQPWRVEIMRLHHALTGEHIAPGRSKVIKVRDEDGARRSKRVQEGGLSQEAIASWPNSCGIDLGGL